MGSRSASDCDPWSRWPADWRWSSSARARSPSRPRTTVRAFVTAAGADDRRALANNRYSADIVAVSRADEVIPDVPDLATDNALPRWLEEARGYAVTDLARRWRLAIDLDSPIDLVVTRDESVGEFPERVAAVRDRVEAFRAAAGSRRVGDPRRRPDVRRRPSDGSSATPRLGRGRSSRSAGSAPLLRTSGHRHRCSVRCSIATVRDRSDVTSLASRRPR